MSEWVSVDERLPRQYGKQVLAICKYPGGGELFYEVVYFWKTRGFEQPVTHWMPLPEPPHHE